MYNALKNGKKREPWVFFGANGTWKAFLKKRGRKRRMTGEGNEGKKLTEEGMIRSVRTQDPQ